MALGRDKSCFFEPRLDILREFMVFYCNVSQIYLDNHTFMYHPFQNVFTWRHKKIQAGKVIPWPYYVLAVWSRTYY